MPTREQTAALVKFIRKSSSPPPPVFVGRQDVIADIESKVAEFNNHGEPKATRILQGAPGAGKSSIFAELEQRSTEKVRGYSILVLSSEDMEKLDNVMDYMTVAAGLSSHKWGERLLKTAARASARLGKSLTENVSPISVIAGFGDVVRSFIGDIGGRPENLFELNGIFPPHDWQRPLIVAIDEMQNIAVDRGHPVAKFLQALHNCQRGLPILPVFAGLGDVQNVLSRAGLTRIDNIHEIDCLTMDEMNDFFLGFRLKFGLVIRDDNNHVILNIDRLMQDSNGWPRHLYHSFQALGNAVRMIDGNLSKVNWSHVHGDALRRRQVHHLGQTSEEMQENVNLTSAIMLGVKDGMDLGDIDELIEDNVRDERRWRLPENMTVRDFRHHLVHRGALQQRVDKTFYCPILSFRTFLINRAKDPELRERAERLAMAERKTVSSDSDRSPPEPKPYDDGSFGYS